MVNKILSIIKDTVSEVVNNNSSVPEDKKKETVKTAVHAVGEGISENFTKDNMPALSNLLKNSGSALTSNPMVSNIINRVVSALQEKVGLSHGVAGGLAAGIVPTVVRAIAGKVNDPNEKGFDLDSLVSSFAGLKDEKHGIAKLVSNIFS